MIEPKCPYCRESYKASNKKFRTKLEFKKIDRPQHECDSCKKNLHLVYYGFSGGDTVQCPVCNIQNGFFEDDYEEYIDDDNYVHNCQQCGIIFKAGVTHGINGCTENTYHALFPIKFDYDGNTYRNKVPIVKTKEDYEQISNIVWDYYDKNVKKYDCSGAYYPQTPQPLNQLKYHFKQT